MYKYSSTQAFFQVSSIGIYFYERFKPLCVPSFLSCYQVLVWHHCRQVFTSCSASQSRHSPFFPSCQPFTHVIKCWCGTIVARFSQVAQRHSHDLCRLFPSWIYLLGAYVYCMLSVPSRACDFHNCCWQSGEICEARASIVLTHCTPHRVAQGSRLKSACLHSSHPCMK